MGRGGGWGRKEAAAAGEVAVVAAAVAAAGEVAAQLARPAPPYDALERWLRWVAREDEEEVAEGEDPDCAVWRSP